MGKDIVDKIMDGECLDDVVEDEIAGRTDTGRKLAEKFPGLTEAKAEGMTYREFLMIIFGAGLELDLITSSEMYDAL